MATINKVLLKELKAVRSAARNFVFVPGPEGHALLLSKRKISGGQVKTVKDESGGKVAFRGRCFTEEGTLVFETMMKPPAVLSKQVRQTIKEQAGLVLKVEFRQATKVEEIDDTSEDETEAPAEPETPEAAEQAQIAARARFKAKLKALQPAYDHVRNEPSPQTDELDALHQEASGLADAGQFDDGLAVLKRFEIALLTLVRGRAATKAKPSTAPQASAIPAAPPRDRLLYEERLKVVTLRFESACEARPELRKEWIKWLRLAQTLAKGGDHAKALQALDRLDAEVNTVLPPVSAADSEKPAGVKVKAATGPKVLFQQSVLAWDSARARAEAELGKLQKSILDHPEVKAHPEFATIQTGVQQLLGELNPFDGRLRKALDAAYTTDKDEVRRQAHRLALKIIGEYRVALEQSRFLKASASNPFGSFGIYAALDETLKDLAGKLVV